MANVATREQFIAAARAYLGTPFAHQGTTRKGIDCYGLIYAACRDVGLITPRVAYRANPSKQVFEEAASKLLIEIPYNRLQRIRTQLEPGDLLSFWVNDPTEPKHLAIYSGCDKEGRETVIHAYSRKQNGVVEMPIAQTFMNRRLHKAWQIPNLGD